MGSIKMVLMLSVITATLALLSANYSEWVNLKGINTNFEECREVQTSENIFTVFVAPEQRGIVGLDCSEGGGTFWFNAIWIIPLGITLLYAFTPLVK